MTCLMCSAHRRASQTPFTAGFIRCHGTAPCAREPQADISYEDAQALGIFEGDTIELTSHRGSIQMKAHLTHKAEPGVICCYHGYSEADVNLLTDNDILDPYSGFPSYRETRVAVRRI